MIKYINCLSLCTSPVSKAATRIQQQCSPTNIAASPKRELRRTHRRCLSNYTTLSELNQLRATFSHSTCQSDSQHLKATWNHSTTQSGTEEKTVFNHSAALSGSDYSADFVNISKLSSINDSINQNSLLSTNRKFLKPCHSTPRIHRRSLRHQPCTADVACTLDFDDEITRAAPTLRRQQAFQQLPVTQPATDVHHEVTDAITNCVSKFLKDESDVSVSSCSDSGFSSEGSHQADSEQQSHTHYKKQLRRHSHYRIHQTLALL